MSRSTVGPPETRSTRGRPAELTRDQIVAAAISIADTEGLMAITMRRVAAELATGAASLYRHVATRSELIALMVDRVLGDDATPASVSEDWRADLVSAHLRWLRYLRRRPWLLDALAQQALGPSAVRLIEEYLRLVAPSLASGPEKMEAITVLGGLVHTLAQHERAQEGGSKEQLAAQVGFLQHAIGDGNYPHLAAALASPPPHPGESADGRVARILSRVLEGLLPE